MAIGSDDISCCNVERLQSSANETRQGLALQQGLEVAGITLQEHGARKVLRPQGSDGASPADLDFQT